jgi:hypothetical protein
MQPTGKYESHIPGPGERQVNVQSWFMHARRKS